MAQKAQNGDRFVIIQGVLPTFDYLSVSDVNIKQKLIAEKSGDKSFQLGLEGNPIRARIRVNQDEIGKITRNGSKVRMVILETDDTESAIAAIKDCMIDEFRALQAKVEEKKKIIDANLSKAMTSINVTFISPDDYR